jgi:NADPH:quinone reductase-like Zn-dependent oxidoreductase
MLLVLLFLHAYASVPSTMHGVVCPGYSPDFKLLKPSVIQTPSPGKGEVLIRVHTSSVNPVDVDIIQDRLESSLARALQKVLGFDVSGEIAAVGPGTSRLKVGDQVWADLGIMGLQEGIVQLGAFAEYAVAFEHQVGLKPEGLNMTEAGVLPLVAITAFQALVDARGLSWAGHNRSVLITSGSGGTGIMLVQMARNLGAGWLISVTSTKNVDFVKSLGANQVIDYTTTNLWDVIPNDSLDVVIDNIGLPDYSNQAMKKLKVGGYLILIQGNLSSTPKPGVHQEVMLCDPSNYEDLDRIKAMVDAKRLRSFVDSSFDLDHISQAYNHSHSGSVLGKVAIAIGNF